MPDELTPEDLSNVKWLMELNNIQLHKLQLGQLREGAQLLLTVSDMLKARGRALHKLCDAREAVGEVDAPADRQPR